MTDSVSSPLPEHLLNTKPPETLQEGLALYELVYMPSRNFAAKTRVDYRNDLVDLIRFLEQDIRMAVTRLSKGELLINHAVYRQPVKIIFPKPAYRQEQF